MTSQHLLYAALVGLGGGAGAVCRYLVGLALNKPQGFPFGTLAVNLLGCFLIGLALHLDERTKFLCVTGFLGGFTTYSAFGLESLQLLKSQPTQGILYLGLHLLCGLAAVWAGLKLAGSPV